MRRPQRDARLGPAREEPLVQADDGGFAGAEGDGEELRGGEEGGVGGRDVGEVEGPLAAEGGVVVFWARRGWELVGRACGLVFLV